MRFRSVGTALLVVLSLASVMVVGSSAGAAETTSDAPTVTVSAPVAAGKGISEIGTNIYDKPIGAGYESVGYVREEYFFEGEATAYEQAVALTADGKWKVKDSTTAPYKSRMVVVKPLDPADFNGTVYVEWLNVTAGFDASRTWIFGHNQMIREGAIWVGISAQAIAIEGTGGTGVVNTTVIAVPTGGLKISDPERYGTLAHPGDAYSYDIFTQAGTVVNGDAEGVKPLEGYKVKRVIATGESQSAGRMTTYVNVVEPINGGQYDAYFILHRGGTPAPLGARTAPGTVDPAIPSAVQIRKDLDVPVFVFNTETDVDLLGYADARQPDAKNFRAWEVAGTSHADAYTGIPAISDFTGEGAKAEKVILSLTPIHGSSNCDQPVNGGGQQAVVRAALVQLERWVKSGKPPTKYPDLTTTGTAETLEITRDENGTALGGLRTPISDVPIAANMGVGTNTPVAQCRLTGTGVPFDAATLAKLYPGGSADFIKAFNAAANKAVKQGIWLKPDAENWKAAASQITFP